jgi:hypothetical protein
MGAREQSSFSSAAVAMRPTVLVTAPGFDVDGETTGGLLRRSGFSLDHAGARANRQPAEVAHLAQETPMLCRARSAASFMKSRG